MTMAKSKITKNTPPKSGFSRTDKILDSAGWFCFIALGLITGFSYFRLPDIIPVHFNALGHPDRYGNKAMLFAVFGVAAFIFLGITLCIKYVFNPSRSTVTPNKNFDFAIRIVRFLRLMVILTFNYMIIVTNLVVDGISKGLGSLFLPLFMISLLFPIAFFFKKTMSPRNKRP
jgi:uncharacterized membrane protein